MSLVNKQSFKLNTGATIPAVGLGTWQSPPGEVKNAVEWALKAGYRHIDAAAIYNNEAEVGAGIKASGVPRGEIFLTSKLWNNARNPEDVEKALDESLKNLGTDYLDLYLIHWPVQFESGENQFPSNPDGTIKLSDTPLTETWKALESIHKSTSKLRAIGVSNFNLRRLTTLLAHSTVTPAVNQIEAHPFLQQPELLHWHKEQGIHITAYSPLGNNVYGKKRVIDDDAVKKIAEETGRTVAQVLVAWAVKRGTSVVPKSVTKERIEQNWEATELTDEAFEKLNALEKNERYNDPIEWGFDVFEENSPAVIEKAVKEFAAKNKK